MLRDWGREYAAHKVRAGLMLAVIAAAVMVFGATWVARHSGIAGPAATTTAPASLPAAGGTKGHPRPRPAGGTGPAQVGPVQATRLHSPSPASLRPRTRPSRSPVASTQPTAAPSPPPRSSAAAPTPTVTATPPPATSAPATLPPSTPAATPPATLPATEAPPAGPSS